MTYDAYSTKRVTVWPEERNGEAGYAIKYQDGYLSWCPKEVYERDYQPINAMSFGHAVHALKAGHKVARAGWNGKGMWLGLVTGYNCLKGPATTAALGCELLPWIGMKTADNKFIPWLASQADVLADDWQVLP
jgi:hypothetical protein